MAILLSHPSGNSFVRNAAMAFEKEGILSELHLGLASCGGNFFERLSALPGFGELRRRDYAAELKPYLRLHPFREAGRLMAGRMGFRSLTRHGNGLFSVDAVYNSFDRKVSSHLQGARFLSAVYAYEDGALETFRRAKALGIKTIYDLPIAYWKTSRRLLEEEAKRYPEWEPTLGGNRDSEEKCARKDEELALADAVICPSHFVRESLPEEILQSKPVHVIPFGSPDVSDLSQRRKNAKDSNNEARKVKVIFAGSMTQRKGLADLFTAMKLLDPEKFELHVLGSPVVDMGFYRQQFPDFIHHPPRPHEQVLELMRSCDLFVLPSIVEGRALVQQEALARGLPIIVTKNAGAGDLVEDGEAGSLVAIRNPEALAAELERLCVDPEKIDGMRQSAIKKAMLTGWNTYREALVNVVKDLIVETVSNA